MTSEKTTVGAVAEVTEPQCEREHARWLEEIEVWRRDHERALEMLAETARFIRRHEAELDDHLREIETHRELYRQRIGPLPEVREKHLEVRHRHNMFKGRHRGLIGEVTKLRVVLHAAAHGGVFE